ncbi:hypothetical protein IB223_05550 [Pseudoxanthomonas sp. PXM03]|jgi:hypothetical protein|uniref:hypothetical protein n=1 Tax=Pseudoxanthomonas sp. PXM03 TaxID=2769284 RepID=UPI00177E53DD|nr:hypothetical protein [Pseudoxanthomonas sp. PXM03]MBD9435554.1 hypothetical protein [Pseudoxanthomonas sp. PXM03]
MCTSAPEAIRAASHRHYFADYEVYDAGQRIAWGQVTIACEAPDLAVQALRARAAAQQGVAAGAIRLRCISRL